MEGILTKSMFIVPSDGSIAKVRVTKECVTEKAEPVLINRRNKVVSLFE